MTTVTSFSESLPRYTSYPPANRWHTLDSNRYKQAIQELDSGPISLYIHVPFCDKRCLFCGCFTIPSKNENTKKKYVEYLKKEIHLFKNTLSHFVEVVQVHFGGGTPTSLSWDCLSSLINHIKMEFPSEKKVAMAIEIDPRTISCRDDLQKLRDLGFNRISLGVQDFDENVQYAIGRIQPKELVERVLSWARSVGFDGINMDLIYGLPCQSVSSFSRTLDAVMQMEPDRIALFSFAYVPQIRSHQFGISTDNLPSLEEKAQIFVYAKERIQLSGYLSIGMDHFCKPHDSLAVAYMNRTLTRNFQGYDLGLCKTIVGFGMSSISAFQEGYFQNTKTLEEYQNLIDHEQLPSIQGYIFSEEDKIRKWVISEIMCWCEVDKKAFFENFSCDFDDVFQEELGELYRKIPGSFFENQEKILKITSSGKFFLRMISSIFDGEFKNAL